jgi:hypothetical protein
MRRRDGQTLAANNRGTHAKESPSRCITIAGCDGARSADLTQVSVAWHLLIAARRSRCSVSPIVGEEKPRAIRTTFLRQRSRILRSAHLLSRWVS